MINKETVVIAFKLFIITALSALCLSLVNKITFPVIENNKLITFEATQKEVIPDADNFKVVDFSGIELKDSKENGTYIKNLYRAFKGDKSVGYVITAVSSRGYGGNIEIMVGLSDELTVNKVKITEIHETAGLGLKAKEPEFINQYIGRGQKLSVIKNSAPTTEGSDIAAISGATVTSNAVTDAVNISLELIKNLDSKKEAQEAIEMKEEITKETERQLKEEKK